MSAETAFGISRFLEDDRREELVEFLQRAWLNQTGMPPGDLNNDLDLLRRWFRPDLSGAGARQALQGLSKIGPSPDGISESVFLRLPGNRGLVTPEGRLLLDLLGSGTQTIDDRSLLHAEATLNDFYGQTYRDRLQGVLKGGDVRPHTFAFVLFLLLNGSIGEERAFRIPGDQHAEAGLAATVAEILDAFVIRTGGQELSPKQRERLKSNWVLTEASAQLPQFVNHSRSGYWLRSTEMDELPESLALVLASRRDPPSHDDVAEALDATYEAYRTGRPRLAALGLAHDDPNRSQAVMRRLLSDYGARLRS